MDNRFKFRCWDDIHREMIDLQEQDVNPCNISDIPQNNIMQCTGLKDKAGNLIFEGDIVKYTSLPSKTNPEKKPFTENYKIVWDETYGGWNTQRYNGINCHCVAIILKQIEVIGNIYQNSELMEKEE